LASKVTNETSMKRAQIKRPHTQWTPERIETMQSRPDLSAAALAEMLGTTAQAVRQARSRFGRFPPRGGSLCICCDERPVWVESAAARTARLCKGCYLREREQRLKERQLELRVRQRAFRLNREKNNGA
jgi:hypothetical protein